MVRSLGHKSFSPVMHRQNIALDFNIIRDVTLTCEGKPFTIEVAHFDGRWHIVAGSEVLSSLRSVVLN